jgi:uncharacterized protein YcaQ
MGTVRELSRADARRIAVSAQLLSAQRPTDVLDTLRHLTLVQNDLTSAVAPNADLVLGSRLGADYSPGDLRDVVDEQRVVDLFGMLRPVEDVALYRAEMAEWPGTGELTEWQRYQGDWVRANDECREDILELLRADGPLPMSALPDTCVVPWQSSGWTNDRNVSRMLDFLVARGEVAVAGRDGRQRLFDLAARVYPDVPVVPAAEARRIRDERRLRALGIARARRASTPHEPDDVSEAGEPAVVAGTKGRWRVDATLLGRPFEGRAALLSPLDRLVFDRKRVADLFEFDYQLEMYKPAAKRRWGYFALPILWGDRLVGKLDATTDRTLGVLRVDAVHEDEPFTSELARAVDAEIEDLASWLQVDLDRSD